MRYQELLDENVINFPSHRVKNKPTVDDLRTSMITRDDAAEILRKEMKERAVNFLLNSVRNYDGRYAITDIINYIQDEYEQKSKFGKFLQATFGDMSKDVRVWSRMLKKVMFAHQIHEGE